VGNQRTAGERMQYLGPCGMHALALACGHHDDLDWERGHGIQRFSSAEPALPPAATP
jgi:hypothetical protein